MWSGESPISANQTAQWLPLKVKCLFRAFEFCLFCILPFVVNLIIRSFYYYFHFYSKVLLHSPFIVYDLVLFWAGFFSFDSFLLRPLPPHICRGAKPLLRRAGGWDSRDSDMRVWMLIVNNFFVLFVCAESAQRGRGKNLEGFFFCSTRGYFCAILLLFCVSSDPPMFVRSLVGQHTKLSLPRQSSRAYSRAAGFNGTLCETTEECSASVDCVATTIDKRRARSHATTSERGAWIVAKFCILVMWTHGSTQKRQKKTTTTNQRESEWLWISRVGQHLFNFNECREKIAESHFYETSWR